MSLRMNPFRGKKDPQNSPPTPRFPVKEPLSYETLFMKKIVNNLKKLREELESNSKNLELEELSLLISFPLNGEKAKEQLEFLNWVSNNPSKNALKLLLYAIKKHINSRVLVQAWINKLVEVSLKVANNYVDIHNKEFEELLKMRKSDATLVLKSEAIDFCGNTLIIKGKENDVDDLVSDLRELKQYRKMYQM